MKKLKLTDVHGNPLLIAVDRVVMVIVDDTYPDRATKIYFDDPLWCRVRDSVEEVLRLIEEAPCKNLAK